MDTEHGVIDDKSLSRLALAMAGLVTVIFGLLLYFNYDADPHYFQRGAVIADNSGTNHDFGYLKTQTSVFP